MVDLGEEVWNPVGIKILGTPIGSPEFVHSTVQQRLGDEGRLWEAIAWVPDGDGSGKDNGTPIGDTSHAPWRTRAETRVTNGTNCVLVVVG